MNIKRPRSLAQRIGFGYALLLTLCGILGGVAVWRMYSSAAGATVLSDAIVPQVNVSTALGRDAAIMSRAARSYGLSGDARFLGAAREALVKLQTTLVEAGSLAARRPELTVLAQGVAEAQDALSDYQQGLQETEVAHQKLTEIRQRSDAVAATFVQSLNAYLGSQNQLLVGEIESGAAAEALLERRGKLKLAGEVVELGNQVRIANYKSQALRDEAAVEAALPSFEVILAKCDELAALTRIAADRQALAEVREAVTSYRAGVIDVVANFKEMADLERRRTEAADRFDAVIESVLQRSLERTRDYADSSAFGLRAVATSSIAGAVIAGLVGVGLAWFTVRSINRLVTAIAGSINQGAMQVATAATQVSGSSQSLAEGASEQAASLEEISSSVEELVSMTKRNSEHAASSKDAANQARRSAEDGVAEMQRLEAAMQEIQQSSEEIGRIIKTIDEIAFQTNILALNAAVEAARAGEAGAGFAVVADEVRALAHRSAAAARDTAEKIEDATKRSRQGVDLSGRVVSALYDIVTRVREVDALVIEVANASSEQTTGLGQVSQAITQMDSVTQTGAANAEETASAAEELNAQSAELREASHQLAQLVGLRMEESAGAVPPMEQPLLRRLPEQRRPAPRPTAASSDGADEAAFFEAVR